MRQRIISFFDRKSVRWATGAFLALAIAFALLPSSLPARPYSTVLLDSSGREIAELVRDESVRHRPTDSRTVPAFFRDAMVAIEDRHYYGHLGVSLRGIGRAVVRGIEDGGISEGASTITAQYVRNALWPTAPRTLGRKMAEFAIAVKLSLTRSKADVLTGYMDSLYFGRLAYGPESAARVWYGRPLSALSRAELLSLVTIAKNPASYDPIRAHERYRARYLALARRLAELGTISARELVELEETEAVFLSAPPSDRLPYVRDFVASRTPPGAAPATLALSVDAGLTDRVAAIAEHVRTSLSGRGVSDYGVVILDRQTMELRALIGGADYGDATSGQVNAVTALRQPGSTLKPFIYMLADEYLDRKPDDLILDLPVSYATAEGYSYEPKNYSLGYEGSVPLAQALAESLNIPAVKLANEVGIERLYDFLRSVGMESLTEPADHYGLALALGAAEVPLWQLTRAYSVFARDGEYCDIRLSPSEPLRCRRVADAEYPRRVSEVLSNSAYKLGQFPLYGDLDFSDRYAVVKTGTSRNYRDTWAVGYTRRYVVGVWSGNKSWAETDRVGSVTGAGAIFARIVRELEPAEDTTAPARAIRAWEDYFEITHPLPGAVFSADTDSPDYVQSIGLRYSTTVPYDQAIISYDGRPADSRELPVEPGEHEVSVRLMSGGRMVSERSVRYSVRMGD